jgi:hypothetical protein
MPEEVWLLWDCSDLAGVYDTEETAEEAREARLGADADDRTRRSMSIIRAVVRRDPRTGLRG